MSSNQNDFNGNTICKDFKDFIQRILDSMPFFIKIVVFSTIILYLLNIFFPCISFCLADIPYYTLFYLNLWRLITTSFMTTGILSIIFSLLFWYSDAVRLEKEIGTIKYMLIFLMNTLFIQILYCLLLLILSLFIQNTFLLKMKITFKGASNSGLWPIAMCDLTLLCLNNPERPMRLFIFPCVVRAKYYPILLFLIFSIISGIDYESLCAIGFGYLYHYFLKNKLYISNVFVVKVENFMLFRWMKNKKGFVNLGGTNLQELENNMVHVAHERNVHITVKPTVNGKVFKAFKGKGIAVGGSVENIRKDNIVNNISSSSDSRSTNSSSDNKSVNSNSDNSNVYSSSDNKSNDNNDKSKNKDKNNEINYSNLTVSSSVDMLNSSDSRLELNSSEQKP